MTAVRVDKLVVLVHDRGRKTLEASERTNNKLNTHMTPSPGIEPEITLVRGERLAATNNLAF
jgi:hypothetical protein